MYTRTLTLAVRGISGFCLALLLASCGGGGGGGGGSTPAPTYTIGGIVSGLSGTGLVLQNNGADNLAIPASGAYTAPTAFASGAAYSITVLTQPTNPSQTCTVSNGSGTVGSANVTNVAVNCVTNTYTISGTVSGLAGTGLVLQDNGGDNKTISGNGLFTFATPVASGSAYAITVLTPPSNLSQTCTVTSGSGTVGGANVTNVSISCSTNSFTVGGTVSGHNGTGLTLRLTTASGTTNLFVAGNGPYSFPALVDGSTYNSVTVFSPPVEQVCTIANGGSRTLAGANVTNVGVTCVTNTYTVGVTVSGLAGTGLVLQNNGGNNLAITLNGAFSFTTRIAYNSTYNVAVFAQPATPPQACTVLNGSGTVLANVNLVVTCVTNTSTIGGTVFVTGGGPLGSGLVLQNNLSDNLSVSAGASPKPFTFTPVAIGSQYSVTVLSQPTNPTQNCTVSNALGTVPISPVTNVTVTCTTSNFTIGGSISGLTGTGLVLQNNGGDNKTISANNPFTFTTPVLSGAPYAVTVLTQPSNPTQTCAVTGGGSGTGSGTVTNAIVNNVVVTCTTNTYTIGATVTGLSGAGLVLQNNGSDNKTISANNPFTFTTPVLSGAPYAVTVLTQPSNPTQTCAVTDGGSGTGSGTVTNAIVNNVVVTCTTNTYTIGGTVTGLAGTGLKLRNNNNSGDEITIAKTGPFSFTFATPIASGATYAVTVSAQPTGLSQTCTVTGGGSGTGSGTVTNAIVNNVSISCATNSFTVGGTVSGSNGLGFTLRLTSGVTTLNLSGVVDGPFVFPALLDGSPYTVSVFVQPLQQNCTVSPNGVGGTLAGANVINVTVACTTNTYAVGGTITGLTGTGLVLRNSYDLGINTENFTVAANATTFTFPTHVAFNSTYSVSVFTQPNTPTQTCTVTNGAGTVSGTVGSVSINCTTNTYTIGGTISGLSGAGTGLVLRNNGSNNLTVAAGATAFTFSAPIASGAPYAVTVFTQPSGPTQNCTVSSGSGTVGGADVTVSISCTTTNFTIGGSISGLTGTGLVLHNGSENFPVAANATTFTFLTSVASGAGYVVTVSAQPSTPTQTCAVTSGSGTVGAANVITVSIACTTTTYTIGGTISGLSGTGLVLHNGSENLPVPVNATGFTFVTPVASGATYTVSVSAQPSTPTQTCAVNPLPSGSGTVTNANVASVSIVCTTNTYTIGGTISGLTGTGLVLHNRSENLPVAANATGFTFVTPVASGATYTVTASTQPSVPEQACTVLNGAGTVVSANVANVSVVCATPTARFAYVPNFGDNTVSIYAVNAATGQLRHKGYVAAGRGPNAVSIDPSGKFVYVANETSGTVSAYSIDAATGALTSLGVAGAGDNPQSIAVDPTGRFVYVANSGPANPGIGSVSAYSIDAATGALSPIGSAVLAGTNPTSLSVDPSGGFVYVANGNSNDISVYSITPSSGALTQVSCTGGINCNGVNFVAGQKPVWITVDPSGKFVYAANFNSGNVSAYKTDTSGQLNPIGAAVATGIGPRSVAVDPSGKFAFVVNQNGGTVGSVSAYNIEALTGALSPTGAAAIATGNLPVGIAIDPFSKLAYVENVGSDDISVYTIDTSGGLTAVRKIMGRLKNQAMAMTKGAPLIYTPEFAYVANSVSGDVSAYTIDSGTGVTAGTGALTPIGSAVAAGTAPRSVGVDPFGRFAYVANGGDGVTPGTVSAYAITGGALSANGTVPAGISPASVSVDPSGRFVYVANRGDGATPSTVSAYAITGTGALSTNGTVPAGISPASVTVDPAGRFAYVANFTSNDISVYAIDASSGVLTLIDADAITTGLQPSIAAGTHPQSVSVDPTGNFAYVANGGDGVTPSTVSAYRIDSTSGGLIPIGSPTAGTNPASIAFDPAGKFAYVALKGDALVSVYTINATNGALTSVGTPALTGTSPASVTVDASGQFAYVANSGGTNVSAYKIGSDGSLTAVGGSPFGAGSSPSAVTTTGTSQ